MDANLLRTINKLWKDRHTHDGEDFQEQITIIRETVEQQSDSGAGTGAYVHLLRSTTQEISVGGEPVEWTDNFLAPPFEFQVVLPGSDVTVTKPGYYDVTVWFGWDGVSPGGTVQVVRERAGVETVVWPPASTPGNWESSNARMFEGTAHEIPFLPDDIIRVVVDHGQGAPEDLEYAVFAAGLVDRIPGDGWELVYLVDNYGVAWDGSSWWTTDNGDNVTPALFERSPDGTALNSYANYDTNGNPDRCRGIVYANGKLWAVGNDELVYEIDPADGTTDGTFSTGGSGTEVHGIAFDGTSLFITEQEDDEIREFNFAGTLQSTSSFPAGRELRDLTWNGSGWWATTTTEEIILMDSAFAEVTSIIGPTTDNEGCHFKDGLLYVMTPTGLYRKAL